MGRFFLKFLMIVSLLSSTSVQAKQTHAYRAFNKADVEMLNQIKNTHALADRVLKQNLPSKLRSETLKLKQDKAQPLPEFKLRGKSIVFQMDQQSFQITHVRGSQFNFNGKMIDIQQKNWDKKLLNDKSVSANLWELLFISEANAVAPIIVGAIVVAGLIFGCVAVAAVESMKESIASMGEALNPNNIYEDDKEEEYNAAMAGIGVYVCSSLGCCANASAAPNKVDYQGFLRDACKISASNLEENLPSLFDKYKFDENNKSFMAGFINDNPEYMGECRVLALNQSVINFGKKLQQQKAEPASTAQ